MKKTNYIKCSDTTSDTLDDLVKGSNTTVTPKMSEVLRINCPVSPTSLAYITNNPSTRIKGLPSI